MKGYWEKPEGPAERLRPGPLPGVLVRYTGENCRLDNEGYRHFVGRMDDIVKSRGEKVVPSTPAITRKSLSGFVMVIADGPSSFRSLHCATFALIERRQGEYLAKLGVCRKSAGREELMTAGAHGAEMGYRYSLNGSWQSCFLRKFKNFL
jgi:acyl-CoA synthetase (AMP-forming)/AMP-acid ligase II